MIFIDSGALVARYARRDQYHQRALKTWGRIDSSGEACFTTNFVLNEAFTLLARRAGYDFAAAKARSIYESRRFRVLRPVEEDELSALQLFEKYADQSIGFADCVSFVLMRKSRLKRVFTFDRHFALAGFDIVG